MVDFRKMFFVFAALVMIMAIPASAQISCVAFVANQPTLRQEGITEPAGDVILTCSGIPQFAQLQSQTLTLYVQGTTITSRQLYSGTSAPSSIPTEAALLVNDLPRTSAFRLRSRRSTALVAQLAAVEPASPVAHRRRASCRTAL